MKRKDFIYHTAVGLAALGIGVSCTKKNRVKIPKFGPQTAAVEFGDIRAVIADPDSIEGQSAETGQV